MNDETASPPPSTDSSSNPSAVGDELRALRRSRSDRVLAGVLGGLAQRLGVDPLVLRITTVVLALFGGVGIMLYALGWLLIPEEDAEGSVAEQAVGRGPGGAQLPAVLLAGVLALAVLITAGGTLGSWDGSVLLVLAAVGLLVLLRRGNDSDRPAGRPPAPTSDEDVRAGANDYPGLPGYAPPYAPEPPEYPAQAAPAAGTGWPDGPDWGPGEPPPWEPEPPVDDPNHETARKPRSALGPLTLSSVAIVLGVIAVNDVTWASVPASAYVATALAIVGLGLLVGTWLGRARGLIAVGLVLSFALPVVTLADRLTWEADTFHTRPTSAAAVPTGHQEHDVGRVVYDLSALELTDTDDITLAVGQGVGELRVVVPPRADVTFTADVGLGGADVFGQSVGGPGVHHSDVDLGTDGTGGGRIELDLDLGLGHIEVSRA